MLRLCLPVLLGAALVACGGGQGERTTASARGGSGSAANSAQAVSSSGGLRERAAALNRAELARAAAGGAGEKRVRSAVEASGLVVAWRFYNTVTGSHFYTTSTQEKNDVLNLMPDYFYEGPAFMVSSVAGQGLSPVYRFFNHRSGVHFYTISEDEKALLQANDRDLAFEGVAYYASKVPGASFRPLYRFFLAPMGFHFYSNRESERDHIVANLPAYQLEGVGYYVIEPSAIVVRQVKVAHSGATDRQCYQAGSHTLVACDSAAATDLNAQQDGHRYLTQGMRYNEVPRPEGGHFDRTECVLDQTTGLVWEGHTLEGSRSAGARYTHYDNPDMPQRLDSTLGLVKPTPQEIDAETNSMGHVRRVNESALCGFSDWRMPTPRELQSLVDYGVAPGNGPMITADWFANAAAVAYWTDSTGSHPSTAWMVKFNTGQVLPQGLRFVPAAVRLVRSGQ